MNFIDTAIITVRSGDGGNGIASFRREKFAPKGGPDGGDGGNGGHVILKADRQLSTLLDFKYKRTYEAETGQRGGQSRCTGRSGESIVVRVPCGTVIRDYATGEQIADLDNDGQEVIIARGGRGGRGNQHFATATNQVPRHCEPGTPGEEFQLEFELKLLADVGLVGYPNVGKSTLISSISAAKPKIADYAFTTLVPNLGLVRVGDYQSYTVADIPGLIEGAHEGRGLGHQFLRHVERTSVLLFVIDANSEHPDQDLKILRTELLKYDPSMEDKTWRVVLSKADTLIPEQRAELLKSRFVKKHKAELISAVSREGMDNLVMTLWAEIQSQKDVKS